MAEHVVPPDAKMFLKFSGNNSAFSRTPVSIIIPFYKQYHLVTKAVESILTATKSNPYEIVLVDNGCPANDFSKTMEKVPQVRVLRTGKKLPFGGALRYGFERTTQPYVVFMHSDVSVTPSWMIEMGRSLLRLKEKGVRMVSARSDNPGQGTLKELTAKRGEEGQDTVLTEGFLPLYCVMCHRELFAHIGGFIKEYPMMYEDEELAFRMKRYGFSQAICSKSWVHHEGGATVQDVFRTAPKRMREAAEISREMCLQDIRALKK